MKKRLLERVESKFNLNILNDLIFVDDRQIYFVIDTHIKPNMCYLISGDLSKIGLPDFDEIEASKLLDFVEPDNLLAEVEGKYTFLQKIRDKFNDLKDEIFFYIPIKKVNKPIWLYVSLKCIEGQDLVLGQVVRIYHDTPVNIIHYQKTYQDSLTRLFSRETLKMHIDYLQNTRGTYLLYLDIDEFKSINDKHGHQAGDQFLIDISNFFISRWEHNVLYYRLGGDEFAVYCYEHDDKSIIERANNLVKDIENLNNMTKELGISVSIGIVKITDENKDYHRLLNLGDKCMYESKQKGKGNITLYV